MRRGGKRRERKGGWKDNRKRGGKGMKIEHVDKWNK